MLYKQFAPWSCNGFSVVSLTDCINNPTSQELIDENHYLEIGSDERIYLDFRASSWYAKEAEKLERNYSKITLYVLLKAAATKKLGRKV